MYEPFFQGLLRHDVSLNGSRHCSYCATLPSGIYDRISFAFPEYRPGTRSFVVTQFLGEDGNTKVQCLHALDYAPLQYRRDLLHGCAGFGCSFEVPARARSIHVCP